MSWTPNDNYRLFLAILAVHNVHGGKWPEIAELMADNHGWNACRQQFQKLRKTHDIAPKSKNDEQSPSPAKKKSNNNTNWAQKSKDSNDSLIPKTPPSKKRKAISGTAKSPLTGEEADDEQPMQNVKKVKKEESDIEN